MNYLKEFANYNNLTLAKGIILTNIERISMFKIINDYITNTYKIDRYSPDIIEMDGKKLSSEILLKSGNNRTLLNKLISDDRGEIITDIKSKDDLFNFIKNNLFDLFNVNGKYFKYVYNLLLNTSFKGKNYENRSFLKFEEIARKKGKDIKVVEPKDIDEDVFGGIDGIFYYNDKRYNIQVKPLHPSYGIQESFKRPGYYIAFCEGMLKELKTDYVILINKNEIWIFRCNGIKVHDRYFMIPKENLVS